jgi:rhodanese-related sulfurtransferase
MFKKIAQFLKVTDYTELMSNGAQILDVRTPTEFKEGHIKGSINIPLDVISTKATEIQKWDKPVILCCRSGMRSGQATGILKSHGVEAVNGGGWSSLVSKLS